MLFETIGWMGVVFGTIMFAPQAIKSIITKHAETLHEFTFLVLTFGILMWSSYALFQITPKLFEQILLWAFY